MKKVTGVFFTTGVLLVIAALALGTTGSGFPARFSTRSTQGEAGVCDLRCWVNKLVVVIPEVIQTFRVLWTDGTFTLQNLTISSIGLGTITTDWYPDANANTSTAVKVTITDVEVDVWSKFKVKWGIISVSGEMVANVSKSTFGLAIQLDKGTDALVKYVDCPYCDLAINIEDAYIKTSSGALDAIANTIIDLFKTVIEDQLQSLACDMIPDMIRSNVTALFEMVNVIIRPYMNTTYPRNIPIYGEMVDMRTSPVIDVARYVLNIFTGVGGPLNFNHVVNLISSNTGKIRLSDWYNETIAFEIPISALNATISIGLLDLNLTQLNTWDYFEVLVPISEYLLNSHTGLQELGINLTFFVNVTVNGSGIKNSEYLYESADLVIHVSNNELWAQMQLASYSGLAASYSNTMCTNISCIAALINGNSTGLTHLIFNTTITLIEMLAAGGSLEADVQQTLDKIIKLFLDNYKFAIPPLLNGLVGGPGTDFINSALTGLLNNYTCEHVDDNVTESVNPTGTAVPAVVGGALSIMVAAVPVWFFLRDRKKKNNNKSVSSSSSSSSPSIQESSEIGPAAEAAAMGISPRKSEANALDSGAEYGWACGCAKGKMKWMKEFVRTDPDGASLLMDKRINIVVRAIMPFILALNIAFFISANTSAGAAVFVVITLGAGKVVEIPNLFSFGLINSIEDMWKAGVYPLSIVIAFFSGLWPYIKLVLMLVVWLMPVSIFKEKWRERALMALDMLGKWSLIDSYVMVVMLVSFHFHVVFPIVNTDQIADPVLIDVFVDAAYGFVAFMLATVLSLIMSHIILFIHRHVKARKDENSGAEATKFKSLLTYCNPDRFVIPIRIGILVLLVVALVLVIVGVSIVSFSFDFYGLAGWALGLLGLNSHREYGVVTLGVAVPQSVYTPTSFTIIFTQVIFMITAFILPILHLATLIFIWVVPLTRKIQKYIYVACEVMNAWSCLEVFVISIIAAILEISQFTTFMVGDKCDFITPYIERFFNDTLGGHNVCFEVSASLKSGCWCLFIACIIYIIAAMIVMRVCRAALDKRCPPISGDSNSNGSAQLDDMKSRHKDDSNSDSTSTTPQPTVDETEDQAPSQATMVIHPPAISLYPVNSQPPSDPEPAPYIQPYPDQSQLQQQTLTEESEIVPEPAPQTTQRTLSRPIPPRGSVPPRR